MIGVGGANAGKLPVDPQRECIIMTASVRILLVEDDIRLSELIGDYLMQYGYTILTETRGDTGMKRIVGEYPDLVILDLMLPGMDGLDVCRRVRSAYTGPILMLTAREEDMDEVAGLEVGADDYIKKPVEPRVLLAHIRALLRRFGKTPVEGEADAGGPPVDELVFDSLVINRSSQHVTLSGRSVELTTAEFALLWFLASNSGQVLDRETIFKGVRGIPYDGLDRTVDIIVSRLRKKLGDNAAKPWRIKTVWGQGYLFVKDGNRFQATGE
jgi:DNA-binding response OmpR family regulator